MVIQHNFKALPQRRRAYIVTMDEFNDVFGEVPMKAFDLFPHPKGTSWYYISTGETFTVVEDTDTVDNLVKEHTDRAKQLKALREAKLNNKKEGK